MLIEMGVLAAAKVIYDMNESDKNDARSDRIVLKSAERKFEAENLERETRKVYQNSTEKLANRKRAILKSSFPRFKDVYERIMKINFNEDSRGIKELFSLDTLKEYNEQMNAIFLLEPMKLTDQQLVASVLVPGAAGLLLTGNLGIGLAWGLSSSIRKDSEMNITMANARKKQVTLYAQAVEAKKEAIDAVCWHLDSVSNILAKLNVLFLKSIKSTATIIEKNGYDGSNYSDEELAGVGTCMNLAKAVKDIVDMPIIDENNQVVSAAKEVIISGNAMLEQFQELMS